MATVDLIVRLFCAVDDRLGPLPRHPQGRLFPSELVTIGLLFALKGGSFRAFYRWLERDHAALFGGLHERTRLLRLLAVHRHCTDRFLADPTFFTVIDTYGIQTLHPWRYKRSPRQLGVKGWCNHRWIVGLKLCWIVNDRGEVVAWSWGGASSSDRRFLPLAAALDGRSITLAAARGASLDHQDPGVVDERRATRPSEPVEDGSPAIDHPHVPLRLAHVGRVTGPRGRCPSAARQGVPRSASADLRHDELAVGCDRRGSGRGAYRDDGGGDLQVVQLVEHLPRTFARRPELLLDAGCGGRNGP